MSRSLHTMGHQCNTSELYSLTQTPKKRDLVLVSEKKHNVLRWKRIKELAGIRPFGGLANQASPSSGVSRGVYPGLSIKGEVFLWYSLVDCAVGNALFYSSTKRAYILSPGIAWSNKHMHLASAF